jgi:hypothetical protein
MVDVTVKMDLVRHISQELTARLTLNKSELEGVLDQKQFSGRNLGYSVEDRREIISNQRLNRGEELKFSLPLDNQDNGLSEYQLEFSLLNKEERVLIGEECFFSSL